MNCAEFQKQLPYIIDGGGNAEQEAHLKTCAVCSDLVQDLRYIAEQAKLLVPMHDPSPKVWSGIQSSLEREGLVRPTTAGRFRPSVIQGGGAGWHHWGRWGAVAAVIALIVVGLFSYRNSAPAPEQQTAAVTAPAADGGIDAEDQQLISTVEKQAPERAEVYKKSLHDVNSYIADAKKSMQDDPNDESAREHLMQAYQQKAMLYDIATSRTTE